MSATVNDFNAVVSDAAFYLSKDLEPKIKDAATKAGWPKDVVEALSIKFDGDNIYLDYPPQLSNVIDDLTYGTGVTPPNPVVLPFKYRSTDAVKQIFEERAVVNLFELEEVFGG